MFKQKRNTFICILFIAAFSSSLYAAKRKTYSGRDNDLRSAKRRKIDKSAPTINKPLDLCLHLPKKSQGSLIQGYCRTASMTFVCTGIVNIILSNVYSLALDCTGHDYTGRDFSDYDLRDRNFTATDLTQATLDHANLKGAVFHNTILTGTSLNKVSLAETTCKYISLFEKNKTGALYFLSVVNIPNLLETITNVYAKIDIDKHKLELLYIAHGFAQLPICDGIAQDVETSYLLWKLSSVCEQLDREQANKLAPFYTSSLPYIRIGNAAKLCWTTNYQPLNGEKMDIDNNQRGKNHIQIFRRGLEVYSVQAKNNQAYDYYKREIERFIRVLEIVYNKLNYNKKLQQEVANIADAFSQSYKFSGTNFLVHYLTLQHRLIQLKRLGGNIIMCNIQCSNLLTERLLSNQSPMPFLR